MFTLIFMYFDATLDDQNVVYTEAFASGMIRVFILRSIVICRDILA